MDLLEIRKKAREKKEAEALAKAAAEATVEAAVTDLPGGGEELSAGPELLQETGLVIMDDVEGDTGADHGQREAASEVVEAAQVKAPEPVRKPSTPAGGGGGGTGAEGPDVPDIDGEVAAEDDIVEYLAFRLAKEQYAVKVSVVKEIIRLQRITMVPRAQDFVEGIISLRGVIIPVFDAKKRLGFEDTGRSRTNRIIILSEAGNAQGMIVDKVTGVARLKKSEIEPPPSVIGGVEAEYIEGLGRIDGKLLILFNTDKILSMEGQPGS